MKKLLIPKQLSFSFDSRSKWRFKTLHELLTITFINNKIAV